MRNATRSWNRPDASCSGNCCSSAGKPRSYRKGEAANRHCEFHVTIRLQRGEKIAIERELESLLDALGGGVEHIDAIFIRFVRGTREG